MFELTALDAVGIVTLGMTLTLDPGRQTMTLYSGNVRISRVHFAPSPNMQMANIAHDIAGLKLDANSHLKTRNLSEVKGPFWTSSPLPQPGSSSSKETFCMSPIVSNLKPRIDAIDKDVANSQVLLHYDNGYSLKISLSPVAMFPLVQNALKALRVFLPCEVILRFMCKWYSCRNALGSENLCARQEWELFAKCLLGQCGYHTENLNISEFSSRPTGDSSSPQTESKKVRPNEHGCDDDWMYLLSSTHHREASQVISLLGLRPVETCPNKSSQTVSEQVSIDRSGPLFPHIFSVTWCLHLLYEENKLNTSSFHHMQMLAKLLSLLTADLGKRNFVRHYWSDFPHVCPPSVEEARTGQVDVNFLAGLIISDEMKDDHPPNIHEFLRRVVDSYLGSMSPFPILRDVSRRTQDLIICHVLLSQREVECIPENFLRPVCGKSKHDHVIWNWEFSSSKTSFAEKIVEFLLKRGYKTDSLSTIPACLAVPIFSAIYECRMAPSSNLSKAAFTLVGRKDLAMLADRSLDVTLNDDDIKGKPNKTKLSSVALTDPDFNKKDNDLEIVESEITRLRWPKDKRVQEVFWLLQSSRTIIMKVEQSPEMSNHDFQIEKENCLRSHHVRRLSLSIGRGAMTLQTATVLPTEPVTIPILQMKGSCLPMGHTVSFEYTDSIPDYDRWPYFHNGVAAGLRVSATSSEDIDSEWIMFNEQNAGDAKDKPQKGGFLMALGLTGHLAKLGKLEAFDFLIRGDENISTGLILGIASAKMGSMDVQETKKISAHLEALLPVTDIELPLSNTTQVASLIGLGLLYAESGHSHMAEICLNELIRTPNPEAESSIDRESYSLAAGIALGMIMLGQGDKVMTLSFAGPNLAETLHHLMVGGPRPAEVSPSFQIQEGDSINIDITSPGATLALGLMFLKTGNQSIASWMNAPESQFLLQFVRPDFLMIRTLAKGLIMWDDITPTRQWIDSHVPIAYRGYCMVRPENSTIDYETINQAYCHIISGAALAMAIRFAGSSNAQAFEVLHEMTLRLYDISKRSVAELAGQATVEQTLCILVLSLGIVMAGSGDLDTIRIARFLGSRVGAKFPTVTYGSHMALHMAMGLLFLGGGRFSLSTEPRAVAAMVCAFYPKFPTHSIDNRYHLQALRHLYVLASEPRLLVPRDIDSGKLVSCKVEVELCETSWYEGCFLQLTAPVMLPELKLIKSVTVKDSRYHEIKFRSGHGSWFALKEILAKSGILHIKLKAGSLSYKDDPYGFRSLTGQCLSRDASFQWGLSASQLLSTFFSDPIVRNFVENFVRPMAASSSDPHQVEQTFGSLLYECATHEKMDLLPFWMEIFQIIWHLEREDVQPFSGDQISLFLRVASLCPNRLLCPEIVLSIRQQLRFKWNALVESCGSDSVRNIIHGHDNAFSDVSHAVHKFAVALNLTPPDSEVSLVDPMHSNPDPNLDGSASQSLVKLLSSYILR